MKRFSRRLLIATLAVLGWIAAPGLTGAEPDKNAQADTARASALIAALGNPGVKVVFREQADSYLVIPNTFNWDQHERLRENIQEITKMGVAAFPALAAHANDDRFCCFLMGAAERPTNVGEICEEIIKCQIDVYKYDVKNAPELGSRYALRKDVLSKSTVSSWTEWWKKHRDKSLLEMQLSVAELSLKISKSDTEDTWRARQVHGLETIIEKLKKEKKPMSGELRVDARLLKRDRITKQGAEKRYSFDNGR